MKLSMCIRGYSGILRTLWLRSNTPYYLLPNWARGSRKVTSEYRVFEGLRARDYLYKRSIFKTYNHVIFCYYRKIRQIIDTFGSNLHIELQQRGIEFSQLFRKYDHLRPALLERMPPMETARPQANGIIGMVNGEPEPEDEKSTVIEPTTTTSDSVSI